MSGIRASALALAVTALVAGTSGCGGGGELPPDVAASAEATRPLGVGAAVPEVGFEDVEGRPVRLAALLQEGPVALVFYRGGW